MKTAPRQHCEGMQEAEEVANTLAPMLRRLAGSRQIKIFVSPFMRTLQTAQPLARALGSACSVEVHPDLFEVGGVYVERLGLRDGPGECLTAEEIEQRFPAYRTTKLPRDGAGWYRGSWECDEAARLRAAEIVKWLRSAELRKDPADVAGAFVVLVIHGHLIDMLLKALLGIADDGSSDHPQTNVFTERPVVFFTPNAATAHISIRRNGGVAIHHIGQRLPDRSQPSKL